MTTYPPRPDQRFAQTIKDLMTRTSLLEQRTQNLDSGTLIQTLTGTIDPAYASGDPMVTVTGAAGLTGPYQHLTSYTPAANDLVLLVPNGQTYIVAGKLT